MKNNIIIISLIFILFSCRVETSNNNFYIMNNTTDTIVVMNYYQGTKNSLFDSIIINPMSKSLMTSCMSYPSTEACLLTWSDISDSIQFRNKKSTLTYYVEVQTDSTIYNWDNWVIINIKNDKNDYYYESTYSLNMDSFNQ